MQSIKLFTKTNEPDLTKPARRVLKSISDSEIIREAELILDKLHTRLKSIDDISHLPTIDAFVSDDGSLLIEWIFDQFRVGFNLEKNQDESGWFLVSDKSAGGINALGYLENANLDWLVDWLICFIESNPTVPR